MSWQRDAHALPHRIWDVAIVGGGPAGSIAALHLARGGRSVVILERDAYPREKVCGDALIADSLRVLDRAGLLPQIEARAFEALSVRVYSPSQFDVVIPSRTLLIRRMELDDILARAAAAAGATVARGCVESVEPGEVARVTIRGLPDPLTSRIAIIATGADVRLLAPVGMVARAEPSMVAVRRYVRSTAGIDHLIFSFNRTLAPGYAWIFPLLNGEYNVGCCMAWRRKRIDLGAALDRFIHGSFTEGITDMEPVRGAVLRCGLTGTLPFKAPNVLVVGETAGTTFPLTGEGIGKAMETAERAAALALRALDTGDLSTLAAYPAEVDALRPRYRAYELAERWLTRPWLTDFVTRIGRRSNYAIACAQAVLNDTADPRGLFSLRGVWNILRS